MGRLGRPGLLIAQPHDVSATSSRGEVTYQSSQRKRTFGQFMTCTKGQDLCRCIVEYHERLSGDKIVVDVFFLDQRLDEAVPHLTRHITGPFSHCLRGNVTSSTEVPPQLCQRIVTPVHRGVGATCSQPHTTLGLHRV